MATNSMTRNAALAAGLVVVGLIGATAGYVTLGGGQGQFAECSGGEIAGGEAAIGGPFELLNASGQVVTDAEVITKPSLLYFGYTFCPDVCPLDTVRNAEAIDVLVERGYDVQSVFISVDAERDTPETVGDFAANIHPDMVGLTGTAEQIAAASKAYRTYYKIRDADDEFYLIDHSTFSYLVLPDSGFAGFFRRDLSGEQLAEQVACYLNAS